MNYQKIPQEPFLFLRQDPQTPPAADSPSDDVFLNTFLQSSQRTSKLINCFILNLSVSDYLNVMFTELLRGKKMNYLTEITLIPKSRIRTLLDASDLVKAGTSSVFLFPLKSSKVTKKVLGKTFRSFVFLVNIIDFIYINMFDNNYINFMGVKSVI